MNLYFTVSHVLLAGVQFNLNPQEIQNIPVSSKGPVEFWLGAAA